MNDIDLDQQSAIGATERSGPKTIGLCMIVKNETKVIRRCLESALPLVDYVFVVDTGSTDGTQKMIRDFLAEHQVGGMVIEEPWRDFAWNRSFALERLRDIAEIDYAMIIDADDVVEFDPGFDPQAFKSDMTHDFYDVPIRYASIVYARPQICSNRLAFSYKGVLHEYLEGPPGQLSRATAAGIAMRASIGGGRSDNPRKYHDDAATLERALATETDPFLISRYTFYLAQSYRDCGEHEKAVENYLKRAELGYWREEIYVGLVEAGKLMAALKRPYEEVIATFERAAQLVPHRAEALHDASHHCREIGKSAEGQEFARRGLDLMQPATGLFIAPWIYEYGLLIEFSVNAYWAGAYRESLDGSLRLLASDKLPESMVKQIAANARFAIEKLKPQIDLPRAAAVGSRDDRRGYVTPLRSAALPSVSVITPTRNRTRFARSMYSCVANQDYDRFEWLIADDSAEPSVILPTLCDDRMRYIHLPRPMSIGAKRNLLIEQARGEVIVQFDDDDYYAPDYVSRSVAALEGDGADMVKLGGFYLYSLVYDKLGYWDLTHKVGRHFVWSQGAAGEFTVQETENGFLSDNHLGYGFSYAFKKSVWRSIPFPDRDWGEDGVFAAAVNERFRLVIRPDSHGECLHILHKENNSKCYPQYELPRSALHLIFPGVESFLRLCYGNDLASADPGLKGIAL